jgi:predicted metal-dependent enzyme (double-stranded beta helix superfamily)
MSDSQTSSRAKEMIRMIEQAVTADTASGCCQQVKETLESLIREDHEFLESRFLAPTPDRYARRLLHRDPQGRFSILVMVWDRGQGTPLHDHAGVWCVECVYKGRIRVTSFDLEDQRDGIYRFEQQGEVMAGVGEAGALIPPFEYHTIENVDESPAVTLHVYGGEMTWCHAFLPTEDGGYRKVLRELSYTP